MIAIALPSDNFPEMGKQNAPQQEPKKKPRDVEAQIDTVIENANDLLHALIRYVRGSCAARINDRDRIALLEQVMRIDAHSSRVLSGLSELNLDPEDATMENMLQDRAAMEDLTRLEQMIGKHRKRPLHHSMASFRDTVNGLYKQLND